MGGGKRGLYKAKEEMGSTNGDKDRAELSTVTTTKTTLPGSTEYKHLLCELGVLQKPNTCKASQEKTAKFLIPGSQV